MNIQTPTMGASSPATAVQPAEPCKWCGELFRRLSESHTYCSAKCRYAARDRKRHVPTGSMVASRCASCRRKFWFRIVTKPRRFCPVCKPSKAPR